MDFYKLFLYHIHVYIVSKIKHSAFVDPYSGLSCRTWSMTSRDQERSAFSTWARLWSLMAFTTGRGPPLDTDAMTITYCPGGEIKSPKKLQFKDKFNNNQVT